MPQFPIHWTITNTYSRDERNREIFKLELDDEWTMVLVLNRVKLAWNHVNTIEIHRKNTTKEFLVSGELLVNGIFISEMSKGYFSQCFKTGSFCIEIASNLRPQDFRHQKVIGHVNISDLREKQATTSANGESKKRLQVKSLEELSKDLGRILNPESSCYADVTLKCGCVSIPAHKIILSARSPVFASMFANPMKESHKNEVDITDMDESVLRALLKYVYTGKTSDLTVSAAADLLFAADKYQLQDLKTVCIYFLKTSVSLQNVWKILVLGDMHSEDLKSFSVEYICNKSGEFSVIKNSQEFQALRKERPDLAMDILETLVQYKDEKLKC